MFVILQNMEYSLVKRLSLSPVQQIFSSPVNSSVEESVYNFYIYFSLHIHITSPVHYNTNIAKNFIFPYLLRQMPH